MAIKIVINPTYQELDKFVNKLPSIFHEEGEVIYEGRNILKRYHISGLDIVVKKFRSPVLINKIAYTYIRASKAQRSYNYAFEILKRGCSTPAPIAYMEEYEYGLLHESYYVSLFYGISDVRQYMNASLINSFFLKKLAAFIAQLHKAGIYHKDLSPGNILFVETAGELQFTIIDINRMAFKYVAHDAGCRNFKSLCQSEFISTNLAQQYARIMKYAEQETVDKINEYSDRFFARKTFSFLRKYMKRDRGIVFALFGPVQLYLLLRMIRCVFFSSKKKNRLFEKEKRLYFEYVAECDFRKVLLKKYGYEQ